MPKVKEGNIIESIIRLFLFPILMDFTRRDQSMDSDCLKSWAKYSMAKKNLHSYILVVKIFAHSLSYKNYERLSYNLKLEVSENILGLETSFLIDFFIK